MLNANAKTDGYYSLVTDLGKKIDMLKDYSAGYMLPSSGMMIISHNGINYLLTAEALSTSDEASIADELSRNKYRFTSRQEELKKEE